jgi:peptidoglycan/xylan/chitin deacetylase (PgdA/CDA1 family)
MSSTTYITTSWDDGHPLDLHVAELLAKHGIRGTFYVPKSAEHGTMTMAQARELGRAFELGAHTLHHVVLTSATEQQAWQEIAGSKSWLEDNTGSPCLLFCPPKGRYDGRHLEMIRRAGYLGLRSCELVSLDFPRRRAGLLVMPTTLQAYPHPLLAFAKNAIKRAAYGNLWRFVVHGGSTEWPELAQSLLGHALRRGGVFHLWGHSWELQEAGQWRRLDEVLRFMSDFARQAPSLTNGQVCQRSLPRVASLDEIELEAETVGRKR